MPRGLGPHAHPAGGSARAGGATGESRAAERTGPSPLPRRRGPLRDGSPLEGPGAVLRVLPWRQRAGCRSQSPDRVDRPRRALHRGPDPPPHRSRVQTRSHHTLSPRGEPRMTTIPINDHTEWLEAGGLGGLSSGTTSRIPTLPYHPLLHPATTPPTGRMVLVNGADAWVEPQTPTPGGSGQEYLTRQRYRPGAVAPERGATLESFSHEPWPTWIYRLADGTRIEHEVFVPARSAFV